MGTKPQFYIQLRLVFLAHTVNIYNVCPAEKRTKHSSILLLRLVRFTAGQTLGTTL